MAGKYSAKKNGKFVFRSIGFFVSYCNAFLIPPFFKNVI